MVRSNARCAAALLSLLVLGGCGGDPRALEYVTTKPTVTAVAGHYELIDWQSAMPNRTSESMDRARPVEIDLEADGTFVASNAPQFEFGQDAPRLVSAKGTWSVDKTGTLGTLSGKRKWVWGVRFDSEPPILSASLMGPLGRDDPPRRLAFVIGDPDAGEGLIFERK